jgi:DNA-binding transcriptional LysR family regulator
VRSALRAGRVDLGLVCEPVTLAGPEATMLLASAELVLFGKPDHPLARAEPTPDRLQRYPVQLSDAAGSFHGVLTRYFEAAGAPPPAIITTGSVEGVKRGVVADGDSVGLLPSFAVEEDVRLGRIGRIEPHPPLPPMVLKALWRQDHALSPVSSALLALIRDALGSRSDAPASRSDERPRKGSPAART